MEEGRVLEQGPPAQLFTHAKYDRTKQFLHKIAELYGE